MIIFDTETTGLPNAEPTPLDKQPKIIEFCAVKLDDKTLVQKAEVDLLINPGHHLSDQIVKITGLRDSDLKGKPPFSAVYSELADFFLGEKILVAHNCAFDVNMLTLDLRRLGKLTQFPWPPQQICTVERTTHLKGFRLNLAGLYEMATNGGKFKGAHRAMNDVKALAECVRWMRKKKMI